MSLTIYKISSYVKRDAKSGIYVGDVSNTTDFSLLFANYYTKTEVQTSGSAVIHFDNITNAYHNNLLGLEGGLVADNSSGESSGEAGEYYHLSKAQYDALGTGGDSLWLDDSIGDLYTITSGAGVYIDDIFIKNYIIDAQDGVDKDLTITAGDALGGAGTDAGDLILRAGDAINGDAGSLAGAIYLSSGLAQAGTSARYVYLGNSSSSITSRTLSVEGSGATVSLILLSKGNGNVQVGSYNGGTCYVHGTQFYNSGTTEILTRANTSTLRISLTGGSAGPTYSAGSVSIYGGTGYDNNGYEDGGDIFIYAGLGAGSAGMDGNIFFGTGAAGYLPAADSSITQSVLYDPTTGQLYYGDGGGTGGGVSLTGSTNNTVCTVTGADAIQGEANLTYDGTDLTNSAGDMYANDFNLNSDRRLKTHIKSYKAEELDITYRQFELKSDIGQQRFGVIAQEIQKTYPELVRENNGHLAVSYIDLLVREIANLKERVKQLENG